MHEQPPEQPKDGYAIIQPDEKHLPPFWITRKQFEALNRKFLQAPDGAANFYEFRSRARATILMDRAITIPWCGMWLAIETDGYTHS